MLNNPKLMKIRVSDLRNLIREAFAGGLQEVWVYSGRYHATAGNDILRTAGPEWFKDAIDPDDLDYDNLPGKEIGVVPTYTEIMMLDGIIKSVLKAGGTPSTIVHFSEDNTFKNLKRLSGSAGIDWIDDVSQDYLKGQEVAGSTWEMFTNHSWSINDLMGFKKRMEMWDKKFLIAGKTNIWSF